MTTKSILVSCGLATAIFVAGIVIGLAWNAMPPAPAFNCVFVGADPAGNPDGTVTLYAKCVAR